MHRSTPCRYRVRRANQRGTESPGSRPSGKRRLAALALAIVPGCQSLDEMAPPVGPRFTPVAQEQGVSLSFLDSGRMIYLTDCTRCHGVEPIGRYSADAWREIIPRMARESKLNAGKRRALQAYVAAAHRVIREQPVKAPVSGDRERAAR